MYATQRLELALCTAIEASRDPSLIELAGWEPVAEWLGSAIHQLAQLTGASFP